MSTKEQQSAVGGRQSESNSKLIFVTGGARSGKSAFALNLANRGLSLFTGEAERSRRMGTVPGINRKCYLATAQALDSEMEERIARHKAERGPDWDNIEEPMQVPEMMLEAKGRYDVILLDCLTLWVSNLMHELNTLDSLLLAPRLNQLISACKTSSSTVIIVSNEVGLGIVPDNALARNFRDIAGTANQLFAKAADEAYFVVSGISMRLK